MPELILTELLKPIEGARPAGEDLRHTATYEKIKEARREDDGLAQGAWQRERKVADWRSVIQLSQQALAEESKDLQLAAWLTEALLRERGFAGLHQGLNVCFGLVETFWEHLYPLLEDGDAEWRAAPLAWLGSRLDVAVKAVPIAAAGYDWFAHKESRALGYESSSATPEQKKAREKALKDGRLPAEAFDKAFAETPRVFYTQAHTELAASLAVLASLDQRCGVQFGDAAPSFGKLRDALEEVRHTVNTLLQKKGEPGPEGPSQLMDTEMISKPAPDFVPQLSAVSIAPGPGVRSIGASYEQATEVLKAGHHQQALQILNRDLATQSCGRDRFLRKLQLARLCLAAGKDSIAQPLLDDLASAIDNHKLDEWEEHETVAAALVTILQSSKRIQSDAKEKQKFFERICRLDPAQALGC